MKAEAMSLTFLGNESLIKIPFFQRGYVWNKSNWEDVLADLLDFNKNHFLGSLILKQQEKQSGKTKEVLVIDGQQRLTTLSILLRSLYNSFDNETQKNCENEIRNYLFYKKNVTDKDYIVKIEHSKIDRKYFQMVIKNEVTDQDYEKIIIEDSAIKTISKDNRILQCYKYFSEQLKDISEESRLNLFNRLLDQDNKIIVLIDLSVDDDEQAIFDTINSAGIRLSSADIIKNAIFQKALDVFGNTDDVEILYKENWETIFAKDEETIAFWDTARASGRLMRDNIEILLHAIAVINGFFDPDKHTLSDLSMLYKEYIRKFNITDLEGFVNEIAKYATLYKEKILIFEKSSLFTFSDIHSRLFHILNNCEITTFHPYILSLFYKCNTQAPLEKKLQEIETLVIRRMITKSDKKNYNKMCKEFINDDTAINKYIAEQTDFDVLNGLSYISNKDAALLLFWIELYRRSNDTKYDMKELKYTYSLEHIMPQKWEEYWSIIDVVDANGNKITDYEAAKAFRNQKIYSIGNMTLLNSSLNTSVRNYEIERKIEGEGKKKGIRKYADLSITRSDIIDKYDAGEKVWDEQRILQREKELAEDILNIW